jgi:hypothetical protein
MPPPAKAHPSSTVAGITHRCTAPGDGVPNEKPSRGAGQLTETCPRRLEERRASKLSQTGGRHDTCQKCHLTGAFVSPIKGDGECGDRLYRLSCMSEADSRDRSVLP